MLRNIFNLSKTIFPIRRMHDRRLPPVTLSSTTLKTKKNNFKNLETENISLKNDELEEQKNLKNYGTSLHLPEKDFKN